MIFPVKRILALVIVLAAPALAGAETTNSLSDAEVQGRALVKKILDQQPDNNFTNTGVLNIRDGNGRRTQVPVQFKTLVDASGWQSVYSMDTTNPASSGLVLTEMTVAHSTDRPNAYTVRYANAFPAETILPSHPAGSQTMVPFAGSDFWVFDLGLEFFQWPQQKILKKEFHRQCSCMVLESTNPHPSGNGYSRIVSWIDEESLGIVDAYAYDLNGNKLKHFYPKSLEKVNGQYQVTSMDMENVQTGSRSVFDFDAGK